MKLHAFSLIVFFFLCQLISAQQKNSISGYIKDASTGEVLIGATVFIQELNTGTSSNNYGFYSLSLPPGTYNVIYSYVSYQSQSKTIDIHSNVTVDIELGNQNIELETVVVTGDRKDANVTDVQTGIIKLDTKLLKRVPILMGEQDILKSIQLMPGIQSVSEGTSGYSVRGGAVDQNLILLDEAPVYNTGHLMGFFSVFNSDAIKNVTLYKGDIPASYGGKLASMLDVRMKDGNKKEFHGEGGIGIIASRLTLEGPIAKDKASFIISGRRTYADIFLPLAKDSTLRNNKLYFYDLNTKLNYEIDNKNKLFLSGYFGQDVAKYSNMFGFSWGNSTFTGRWNHIFSNKIFSNLTLFYSNYHYNFKQTAFIPEIDWTSEIYLTGLKYDFSYFNSPSSTLRFGVQTTYQYMLPGKVVLSNQESDFNISQKRNLEHAAYILQELKVNERLKINYGLRATVFQNIGKATEYTLHNFEVTDTVNYSNGKIYNTYFGLEPRISTNFMLTETSSLKASYNRTQQYIQLASNSSAGTPIDVWFPASPQVKPQISDQVSLGYYQNFHENSYELSMEGFYKKMKNQIDFVDNASLLLNEHLEKELRFGKAYSYGLEFLLKKNNGRFNGWISYTYSRAKRKFSDLNEGLEYNSNYDKPHNLILMMNYDLSKRIIVSANWVYVTGAPITYPSMRFDYGNMNLPIYGKRNSSRLPNYHRLDLSVTVKGKIRPQKRWYGEWNFSVYNAYNQNNAYSVFFERDKQNLNLMRAYKMVLFGIVPSITYNFRF